jgi:hypothetical protein
MLIRTRDHARIYRRQCVACGYGGRFVDRPGQSNCPRCACDFSSRPPRSYAEMEGLEEADIAAQRRRRSIPLEPEDRDWRMLTRWMVFLVGVGLVAGSVVVLGFAAFVVR